MTDPKIDSKGSGPWLVYFETGLLSDGTKVLHKWRFSTKGLAEDARASVKCKGFVSLDYLPNHGT